MAAGVAARFAGPPQAKARAAGARVIYFNADDSTIWLLIVYKKAKFDDLSTSFLVELKQGVEDAL